MKINKTMIAVLAFIFVLILAGYSAKSKSDDNGFRVGVGKSVVNSHLSVGELSYEYNNWEFSAGLLEAGDTKNGHQDKTALYSVSYLTKPDWSVYGVDPYFRLGVSYNDNSELVGRSNFRLGIGFDFHDVWRLEYSHHSSSGIHDPNTGIDYITLVYKIPNM